ncbi:MAG: glycosyltransferase N-terminal domain-containing protein, partial [Bacteroidota bacterium]
MLFLYNIAIRCYYCAIWLASFFNDKARLWIEGRRHNFQQLKSFQPAPGCKVVWLHAASLGEFEQGRPLLEAIKKQQPATQIILSFFSPSGYQIRKDYELADHVCYLPLDTATNAKAFVAAVQPDIAIFVKYEFWYHHLHALRSAGVRTFLVAGIFRKGQLFFKPYGGLFRNILHCFDVLLVQDDSSAQLLSKRLALPALVAGDPRVDRVLDIGASGRRFPKLEEFKGDSKVLIIGSSWPADEQLLARLFQEAAFAKWKFVLAPHEIGETHLRAIEKQFEPCVRYTQAGVKDLAKARILLVDTIGMLSSLYTYGNMAYIGGGFGAGIH